MKKTKAIIYERIFKKKYLDKQKRICNENIRTWLEAMVENNSKRIGKKSVKEAVDYANSLIALSNKNELEQIAMIHSVHWEKLNPIYGEQTFVIFEPLLDELYRYYPNYKPKDRKEFLWPHQL